MPRGRREGEWYGRRGRGGGSYSAEVETRRKHCGVGCQVKKVLLSLEWKLVTGQDRTSRHAGQYAVSAQAQQECPSDIASMVALEGAQKRGLNQRKQEQTKRKVRLLTGWPVGVQRGQGQWGYREVKASGGTERSRPVGVQRGQGQRAGVT
jgi:hypothetical protein